MTKDYTDEIELIEKNKRIKNKLLFFHYYDNFYSDLSEILEEEDFYKCDVSLKQLFKLVCKSLNSKKGTTIDSGDLMKIYLAMIKQDIIYSSPGIQKVVDYNFEKINSSEVEYVKTIDKGINFSLNSKVEFMSHFKDIMTHLNNNICDLFNEEECDRILTDIYESLIKRLECCFMLDNFNSDDVLLAMDKETRDYFINRAKATDFKLGNMFGLKELQILYNNLGKIEQQVCFVSMIYGLFTDESLSDDEIDNICEELKIRKSDFFESVTVINASVDAYTDTESKSLYLQ